MYPNYTDRQNIIFIDLKTIRKKFGVAVKELTPIEKWGLFFSYVDKEEYADYISELVRSEKGIMAAENVVKYMSEADDNWFVQNSRFIAERDKNTQIHNARQEGAQQKAIETAINFLKEGDSPKKVARCIGLSLEEVQKLADEITGEKT